MPDGFLPRASGVDGIQRQGDFDELAGGFDGVGGHLGKGYSSGSSEFGGQF